jgi:RNA polymerase sigma-70 factor, ECF subfamily
MAAGGNMGGAVRLATADPEAEALLRRTADGDRAALGQLYDRFASLANGLALRILRDVAEAEDVVQEVFLQVWRQADRFDAARGTPEAWICTIARSRALDRLRRRAARKEDAGPVEPFPAAEPATDDALAVRTAVAGLSEDQRRAVELAYYEGLTQTEIARRLGEPLGTIKTRIRTAMMRLREALQR